MLIRSPGAGLASAVVFFSAALWGIYWIPLRFLEEQGISGTMAVAVLNMPAILPLLLLVGLQWRAHRGYLGRMLLIGIFTGMAIALYSSGGYLLVSGAGHAAVLSHAGMGNAD